MIPVRIRSFCGKNFSVVFLLKKRLFIGNDKNLSVIFLYYFFYYYSRWKDSKRLLRLLVRASVARLTLLVPKPSLIYKKGLATFKKLTFTEFNEDEFMDQVAVLVTDIDDVFRSPAPLWPFLATRVVRREGRVL